MPRDAGDARLPVQIAGSLNSTDGMDTSLSVFATRNSSDGGAKVYLSNFRPDDGSGTRPDYVYSRTVKLQLKGLSATVSSVSVATTNSTCANSKAMWAETMGSVDWPDAQQLQALRKASEMCVGELPVVRSRGVATVTLTREAYAAAALTVPRGMSKPR
jgi:hypothetical protein